MSIHDSSPLNYPSQYEVPIPHWVRDFFCLSSNGSLMTIPLLHPIPLRLLHDSRRITYPLVSVHIQWYVSLECWSTGIPRMTGGSWRGLNPLLGQIRHNDRRQREPALIPFHVPWESIERDWIGYHVWLGADITKLSCPLWSTYGVRSSYGLHLSFDPGPAIMHRLHIPYVLYSVRSTLCLCMATKRYAVRRTLEYTRRLCICWDMKWSSALLSMEENTYFYRNYLATKGVCRISS